MGGLTFS